MIRPAAVFLLALLAALPQAPGARPLMLGAVLQQGYVYSFGVYASGQWTEAPLDSAPGPWAFHPVGGGAVRELQTGPAAPAGFCGDLVPPLPAIADRTAVPDGAPSTDVHASHGLALRGDAHVTAFERIDTSRLQDASAERVRALVERELRDGFRRAYGDRPAPGELATARRRETWWRSAMPGGGSRLYRVEYALSWPRDARTEGIVDLELWLLDDPGRPELLVLNRFLETDIDEIKTSTTVTPYGVLARDGRMFVVSDEHGWEHVDYVIREVRGQAFVERLRVLGPCAG